MTSQFIPKPGSSSLGSKGFTLVELAVVLIILGAIFMSVLKVESMVKNAKIRQVINQYREVRTAILVYKDKYGYLPGDDPNAFNHVGSVLLGNGDHKIDMGNPLAKNEYLFFFEHLSKSGLIKGYIDGNMRTSNPYMYYPTKLLTHAFNGPIMVSYNTYVTFPLKEGSCIRLEDLPVDVAQALDAILDDGDPTKGSIRAATQGSPTESRTPIGSDNYSTGELRTLLVYIE